MACESERAAADVAEVDFKGAAEVASTACENGDPNYPALAAVMNAKYATWQEKLTALYDCLTANGGGGTGGPPPN